MHCNRALWAGGRLLVQFGILFLLLGGSYLATAQISPPERKALITLFNSTHGENWKNNEGWLSSETGQVGETGSECSWSGVTCDKDKKHVTELLLSNSGLNGPIPTKISQLRELEILDLSFNQLEGQIPKGLFGLRRLERLDLSQNRLRGVLPQSAIVLRNLETIRLSGNYLANGIEQIARFPGLVELDLSRNRFSDSVPRTVGFLSKLERLYLNGNAFKGTLPPEIGQLHSLKELALAHNHFSGILPDQIGKMSNLEMLDLSYNNFAGPLPRSFQRLNNLRAMVASHNNFEGRFPIFICQDSLFELDLSANQFDGEFPTDMTHCNSLQTLLLANNAFRGILPPNLFDTMASLRDVDLSSNYFSGTLPSSLGTSLSTLNLSDNKLSGDISHVTWREMRALRMDRNQFSGLIPGQLLADSLRELTLSSNQLSGQIPEGLCGLGSLRFLDLSHNQLMGSLCERIGDLEDLNILNLSYNQLDGTLPESIARFTSLTSLSLSNNSFKGQLPRDANLRALQKLDISFNRFTGELPPWIGHLTVLRSANFRNNAFGGTLTELAKLKRLDWVDIRDNNWSAQPPQSLIKLQYSQHSDHNLPLIDPHIVKTKNENDETLVSEHSPGPAKNQTPGRSLPSIVVHENPTPDQVAPVVSGIVTDPALAPVPNAMVTAESSTGKTSARTDDNGRFTFQLSSGNYHLEFASPGFAKASEDLSVKGNTSYTIEAPLAVGAVSQEVEVSAEAAPTRQGLWWNSWITRRGFAENSRITGLTSKQKYSFYLELSGIPKRDQDNGEASVELDKALLQRLTELLADDVQETTLFIRVSVIGRAAVLSTGASSVSRWSSVGWQPTSGSTSSAALDVDLTRLLPSLRPSSTGDETTSDPIAYRGGAVRFGIDAVSRGCAVVAISIWDETRSVPLDHLVRALGVDGQAGCTADIGERQTSPTLYSEASRGITPDVSLHAFEFTLNGAKHSASFMVLKNPIAPCESYNWDSDATITELVLGNESFKGDLDLARNTDGVYSSLGEQITNTVFSSTHNTGPCGSIEALETLKTAAHQKEVRMFARVSDENGALVIAPLGLMAMFEQGGKRVFEHDIRLFQPIAKQTLSETACVSGWTFVLPSDLEGVNDKTLLTPPTSLINDDRVLRSRDAFISKFEDVTPDIEAPSGLLLLAHHEAGVLRFSGAGDTMAFTQFKRDLGLGSIVVLSACETANLTESTKLVGRLNQEGADALVVALFELPADFGIKLSFNFAQAVAQKENLPLTLEDAFKKAVDDTVKEFSRFKGDRARGMGLELVLAGNPKLQICAPSAQEPPDAGAPH